MFTAALIYLGCVLVPPAQDTPDFRLELYYHYPETEFCYKWDPDDRMMELKYAETAAYIRAMKDSGLPAGPPVSPP